MRILIFAAVLSLLFGARAEAGLIGSTYYFNVTATGDTAVGEFTAGTYTDPSDPGFCVGPPVNCSGGQGLSGTIAFADLTPTESTITFTFWGTSFRSGGSFSIEMGDFVTTDGSIVTDVAYASGNLEVEPQYDYDGTYSGMTWDGTDAVFTFTDSPDYASYGGAGNTVVFDVTEQLPAPPVGVPEPGSLALLATALVGFGARRWRRRIA